MKYTQIPVDTFKTLQMNAGIIVDTFDPETGEIGNIAGATTGGISFDDTPEYMDLGEDIDNCPKKMKELMRKDTNEVKMAGTFASVKPETVADLVATADISTKSVGIGSKVLTHIVPRIDLLEDDFNDKWWVGDYSDQNGEVNGGFIAIHLINSLCEDGFKLQTGDKAKGTFAFNYTGHYSIKEQKKVPYEIFMLDGAPEA